MTDTEIKDPTLGAVETYGQPDFARICENGEFNLFNNLKWTMWEYIEYDKSSKAGISNNYEKLLKRVAWFDNMISFHRLWPVLPHSKVSNVLYEADGNEFRAYHDY